HHSATASSCCACTRLPPSFPLFPYTTLFRSGSAAGAGGAPADDADELLAQRVIRRARPGEGDAGGRRLAQRSGDGVLAVEPGQRDRKSTRLNSSHVSISYAVFCLKKKNHTDR